MGSFIEDRETFILDGLVERTQIVNKKAKSHKKKSVLTDRCKRIRHEQSDMVLVLLNLSYIPDDVIKHIDFNPGWQKRFHGAMRGYKIYY